MENQKNQFEDLKKGVEKNFTQFPEQIKQENLQKKITKEDQEGIIQNINKKFQDFKQEMENLLQIYVSPSFSQKKTALLAKKTEEINKLFQDFNNLIKKEDVENYKKEWDERIEEFQKVKNEKIKDLFTNEDFNKILQELIKKINEEEQIVKSLKINLLSEKTFEDKKKF